MKTRKERWQKLAAISRNEIVALRQIHLGHGKEWFHFHSEPTILIEKAGLIDLPKILDLQKLCYHESGERYNNFAIAPLTQTLQELEAEYRSALVLKASMGDTIVGSIRAFVKNGDCYIGRVIVHPAHQNKDIGKELMKEIEKRFSDAARFELFTGFRDEKNLHFYKTRNYVPYKEEKISDDLTLIYLEKRTVTKLSSP